MVYFWALVDNIRFPIFPPPAIILNITEVGDLSSKT